MKEAGRRPKKKKNEKNRKKYITIGFRVSPEERDELYKRINLTGRMIQEYMLGLNGLRQELTGMIQQWPLEIQYLDGEGKAL